MKFWNVACCAVIAGVLCLCASACAQRVTLNFNPDWRFIKGDPSNAPARSLNDSGWANISAPHTYNDSDTFNDWVVDGMGEVNQWSGRTWYRKTFTLPSSLEGQKVYIEFEAVRQVAEVYLNGKLLGTSKTGFVPFGFDLTPHVVFGKPNVLAVMCDNRFARDSRTNDVEAANAATVEDLRADQIPWNNPRLHPAHGGIYRDVRLYVVDPLHISLPLYSFLQTTGPYIYASEITAASARVNVEVPIENSRRTGENVTLVARVLNHNGAAVLTMRREVDVVAGASAKFNLSGILPRPEFWEAGYPYLYRVVCALEVNGQTVDSSEASLGIRTATWTADQGVSINGHHEKLHGWNQRPTDEWPGLGAAQPDWLHFLTLKLMQEAGANWVRWGNGAAGPEMIAACNELGIMVDQPGVDNEADASGAAWTLRATAFRDTIIRYRNDPAILMWEGASGKLSPAHASELRSIMETYDPKGGRVFGHRQSGPVGGEFTNVLIGMDGVWPAKSLPMVEGEYDREESPRRVWDEFSSTTFSHTALRAEAENALTSEQFAVNQMAHFLKKPGMPGISGGANWVFSDSTGSGRDTAEVAGVGGEVDGVRLSKEAYYVCRAIFDAQTPQVHIVGHWSYPAGTHKTIYVVSNRGNAELFLNGRSLGFGKPSADGPYIYSFENVAWAAGEIKAVAYVDKKAVAFHTLRTAGPAVALRLKLIANPNGGLRADGSDILLVDVEAVDALGERCPTFDKRVDFETKGPGTWRGGYNSGKTNSINNSYLDLECGINRVAIRATRTAGKITLRATCAGLKTGIVSLRSAAFDAPAGYSEDLPAMTTVQLPTERPAHTGVATKENPTELLVEKN